MAFRTNTLLSRYYNHYGDTSAVGEDCLKADWRLEGNMYCHPPFAMIPQILQKLVWEKVELTLVALVWLGHFWITLMMEYSMTLSFVLDHENLIMPAVPAATLPVASTLKFMGGRSLVSSPPLTDHHRHHPHHHRILGLGPRDPPCTVTLKDLTLSLTVITLGIFLSLIR
jgi:hypothetical protein